MLKLDEVTWEHHNDDHCDTVPCYRNLLCIWKNENTKKTDSQNRVIECLMNWNRLTYTIQLYTYFMYVSIYKCVCVTILGAKRLHFGDSVRVCTCRKICKRSNIIYVCASVFFFVRFSGRLDVACSSHIYIHAHAVTEIYWMWSFNSFWGKIAWSCSLNIYI